MNVQLDYWRKITSLKSKEFPKQKTVVPIASLTSICKTLVIDPPLWPQLHLATRKVQTDMRVQDLNALVKRLRPWSYDSGPPYSFSEPNSGFLVQFLKTAADVDQFTFELKTAFSTMTP